MEAGYQNDEGKSDDIPEFPQDSDQDGGQEDEALSDDLPELGGNSSDDEPTHASRVGQHGSEPEEISDTDDDEDAEEG